MSDGENDDTQVEVVQPGAVISPGATPPPEPQQSPAQPAPEARPAPQEAPPEQQGGFFNPEADTEPEAAADPNAPQAVSWTASEFVAHDKSAGWYLGLAVVAAILAFFVYLVSRDFVSVAVIVVAALILGVYGSHRPRELEYRLNRQGLSVGGKYYGYDQFKSYSVVPEGEHSSIVFTPLKRFATSLSIYFGPDDEDKIMSVLSGCLPYEEPRRDAVDSLMRKIRF